MYGQCNDSIKEIHQRQSVLELEVDEQMERFENVLEPTKDESLYQGGWKGEKQNGFGV